jgi:hypothetical protein
MVSRCVDQHIYIYICSFYKNLSMYLRTRKLLSYPNFIFWSLGLPCMFHWTRVCSKWCSPNMVMYCTLWSWSLKPFCDKTRILAYSVLNRIECNSDSFHKVRLQLSYICRMKLFELHVLNSNIKFERILIHRDGRWMLDVPYVPMLLFN